MQRQLLDIGYVELRVGELDRAPQWARAKPKVD